MAELEEARLARSLFLNSAKRKSKKGKKGKEEQKILFCFFLPFLPFLLPRSTYVQ